VADAGALAAVLGEMPADAYPLLVQERIVGPGVGVFLLIWQGQVRAAFAHRRIREKPPGGGVSVVRESIVADPRLLALSEELLKQFDWEGVAMVEYKVDARTQTPYIMEINGRFWGSLQLAIDAGVDFPALLIDVLQGRQTSLPAYHAGVRTRWWWGDVDHLIARLRHSDAALALDPGAPTRSRAVLDFLAAFRPGYRNEILRWRDPMPAFRETLDWLRRK
jgi:predicted ATP-grasp superfamily ATP-dependent carboligase